MALGEDNNVEVLVAGELFADLVMTGFDTLPQPGEEVFARAFRREPGGAAITAMGLARLGRRSGLIGAVGALDGAWLLDSFWRGGVDVSRVLTVPGEYTGTSVAISGEGERAFGEPTFIRADNQLLQLEALGFEVPYNSTTEEIRIEATASARPA